MSGSAKTVTCYFNCVCTREVCDFKHIIRTLEERKFASKVLNNIPRVKEHQTEENPETRRASCSYGQLCDKESCGFRHNLDFDFRSKFSAALNAAKETKKTAAVVAVVTTATSEVSELKTKVATLEETVAQLVEKLSALSTVVGKMSIKESGSADVKTADWADSSDE